VFVVQQVEHLICRNVSRL